MTEKIEWYKEVLELEPNSKVFFPLARLLTDAGRPDEAIQVLEQGLARHAEFLEARLFLIDLLHKAEKHDACEAQIAKLSRMFSEYVGFWQAWAASAAASGNAGDTATALRFLALNFSNGPVSLKDILECGIAAMAGGAQCAARVAHPLAAGAALASVAASGLDAAGALPEKNEDDAGEHIAKPGEAIPAPAEFGGHDAAHMAPFDPDTAMADDAPLPEDATATPLSRMPLPEDAADHDGACAPEACPPPAEPVVPPSAVEATEDGEERFSLRTRSMAEVLAEQGDIKGALDIYHELAAAAVHPEESADLRQRIATLSTRLGAAASAGRDASQEPREQASGKDKLISMLEALAERVEARAHS